MATFKSLALVLALSFSLIGICAGQELYFSNPIHDYEHQHPAAILHLDGYYYTIVNTFSRDYLQIFRSELLTNFNGTEPHIWWPFPDDPNPRMEFWAPKMHMVNGELYLYFTHQDQAAGDIWRIYVAKANNNSDPLAGWGAPQLLLPNWHQGNIDATVMRHGGKNYLLFCNDHDGPTQIFISEMLNATHLTGPAHVIKYPTESWECEGRCTAEAPHAIYDKGMSTIVYTISGPKHKLSYMTCPDWKDPMNPASWTDLGGIAFDEDVEQGMYNMGHGVFTDSPDGTETWMLYAYYQNPTRLPAYAGIERIDFNYDGIPIFPPPHGSRMLQPVPSGQTRTE